VDSSDADAFAQHLNLSKSSAVSSTKLVDVELVSFPDSLPG